MKKGNHKADQQNANKGSKGVNKSYSQKHGNRGKQMNPNQKKASSSQKDLKMHVDMEEEMDWEAYYAFDND